MRLAAFSNPFSPSRLSGDPRIPGLTLLIYFSMVPCTGDLEVGFMGKDECDQTGNGNACNHPWENENVVSANGMSSNGHASNPC